MPAIFRVSPGIADEITFNELKRFSLLGHFSFLPASLALCWISDMAVRETTELEVYLVFGGLILFIASLSFVASLLVGPFLLRRGLFGWGVALCLGFVVGFIPGFGFGYFSITAWGGSFDAYFFEAVMLGLHYGLLTASAGLCASAFGWTLARRTHPTLAADSGAIGSHILWLAIVVALSLAVARFRFTAT